MFEQNIDDFYENMTHEVSFEEAYDDYDEDQLLGELSFMKLMKEIKDAGRNLIIIEQKYEM